MKKLTKWTSIIFTPLKAIISIDHTVDRCTGYVHVQDCTRPVLWYRTSLHIHPVHVNICTEYKIRSYDN